MTNALQTAKAAANTFKGVVVDIRRCRDTDFPQHPLCYVVNEQPSRALVVYDDEPGTIVSTGNRPGRFEFVL